MLVAEVEQELVEGMAAGGGREGRLLPVGSSRMGEMGSSSMGEGLVEERAGVQFAWRGRLG